MICLIILLLLAFRFLGYIGQKLAERAQAKAQQERRRQIEAERERVRRQREEARLARIEKEQARQAEQLAKHEEQILRLEQTVQLAEREIAHYQPIVDQLRQERDRLAGKVQNYERLGLLCGGYKDQLDKLNEKIFRMETKIIKAENLKLNAQRKLAA